MIKYYEKEIKVKRKDTGRWGWILGFTKKDEYKVIGEEADYYWAEDDDNDLTMIYKGSFEIIKEKKQWD